MTAHRYGRRARASGLPIRGPGNLRLPTPRMWARPDSLGLLAGVVPLPARLCTSASPARTVLRTRGGRTDTGSRVSARRSRIRTKAPRAPEAFAQNTPGAAVDVSHPCSVNAHLALGNASNPVGAQHLPWGTLRNAHPAPGVECLPVRALRNAHLAPLVECLPVRAHAHLAPLVACMPV